MTDLATLREASRRWLEDHPLPVFAVGDQVRVTGHDILNAGKGEILVGEIAEIIDVHLKARAPTVHLQAWSHVYTVRFANGDTWGIADAYVQAPDAPYKASRRKF